MKPVALIVLSALTVAIHLTSPTPALAATIHVPGVQPTIQEGIDSAQDGDIVLVAPGTYYEHLDLLGKAVTVQSEAGPDSTVIDAGGSGRGVRIDSGEGPDTILNGFTVRNGQVTGLGWPECVGGGILCRNASPTIESCIVTGNQAKSGGGIYVSQGTPTIINTQIVDNAANMIGVEGGNGGGIQAHDNSTPVLINCLITGNSCDGYGAGVCVWGGPPPRPTLLHCTITENTAGVYGGCVYIPANGEAEMTNSICWENNAPSYPEIFIRTGGDVTVEYSDILGGWPGEGNIDADPLFVGGGDFHLLPGSPCIDSGTDAGISADIDWDSRPSFSGFDMGMDEYSGPCWDLDGDGYADEACGGEDCDDSDLSIHPGAQERCDDGIDQDCDSLVDDLDPDCVPEFTLALDATCSSGILSLDFTVGAEMGCFWATVMVVLFPSAEFIPLWTVPLPAIMPSMVFPVSLPVPDLGWIGIYSGLYREGGREVFELEWVDTGEKAEERVNPWR